VINWVVPQNIEWSSLNVFNYIKEKIGKEKIKLSHIYRENSINVNYRSVLEPSNYIILNLPENILKVAEKRIFRVSFRRILPEYSPKIYILRQHFLKFPLIVRPDYHSRGKNFKIVKSYEEVRNLPIKYTHGIEIIYPNDEYRVICGKKFNEEIIIISFKKKEITYEENEDDWLKNVKPKNYARGNSIFRWLQEVEGKNEIKKAAKEAFILSGLHFGAVDILWDKYRKIPFVIEINSRFSSESNSLIRLFGNYVIQYHKDWQNSFKRN